ncbi:DNRLRE domain-containing protein [Geosporobacter ferrireducens]|uniref:Carbohydrate-binding module family 96 domain-containing protein n=1 Tax=Geosporobacter ferrireducens TaxID=1424294 RepID=A0A1D8GEM3_9FIRM|nr:DNRLRE domain-containing protein [Geosporobacter ferrireducens]AOT69338.1 hypothetical protein Gferi_06980 [Geosporobacter ferrireducens]
MPILFLTPTDAAVILQLLPNQNFGPAENLLVGRTFAPNDVFRTLLRFDISPIPPASVITNVTLRLFFFQKIVPGVQPLTARRLVNGFSENIVTWNTQPTVAGEPVLETVLDEDLVGNYIYLSLTQLVQGWYEDLFQNNGILLTTFEDQTSLMGFRGYENGMVENWPTLIIEFESAIGPTGPTGATGPAGYTGLLSVNRIYVANRFSNNVSVIDGMTSSVIATIPVGNNPSFAVKVNPITNRIYVSNLYSRNVSVIDGITNTVIDTIQVGE